MKPCFLCARKGITTPSTIIHMYDMLAGTFARDHEPQTCSSCADEMLQMTDEARAALFDDFPKTDNIGDAANILRYAHERGEELKIQHPLEDK